MTGCGNITRADSLLSCSICGRDQGRTSYLLDGHRYSDSCRGYLQGFSDLGRWSVSHHSVPSKVRSASKHVYTSPPADILCSLRLEAKIVEKKDDKYDLLLDFLRNHRGSTLIYVTQQKVANSRKDRFRERGANSSRSKRKN
jgi:hypothetical protein